MTIYKASARQVKEPKTTPEGEVLYELIGGEESIVSIAKHVGHALVEVESGKGSPMHHHNTTEEVYHILKGQMDLTVDGVEDRLDVDDVVYIQPGQVHQYTNPGPGILRFVVISGPPWTPDDMHIEG